MKTASQIIKESCCATLLDVSKQELIERVEKLEKANELIERLKEGWIPPKVKAGCIGEFDIEVEQVCPQCFEEHSEDCDMCYGNSDENGYSTYQKPVPWDMQKDIFKMFVGFAIESMEDETG